MPAYPFDTAFSNFLTTSLGTRFHGPPLSHGDLADIINLFIKADVDLGHLTCLSLCRSESLFTWFAPLWTQHLTTARDRFQLDFDSEFLEGNTVWVVFVVNLAYMVIYLLHPLNRPKVSGVLLKGKTVTPFAELMYIEVAGLEGEDQDVGGRFRIQSCAVSRKIERVIHDDHARYTLLPNSVGRLPHRLTSGLTDLIYDIFRSGHFEEIDEPLSVILARERCGWILKEVYEREERPKEQQSRPRPMN